MNSGLIMSEAEYAALAGLRASWVKTLASQTPAHLFARMNSAEEDTDAFRVGRALHCAALRPADFANEFATSPKFDRRTKAGKEAGEAFAALNVGKTVVDESEYAGVGAMVAAMQQHNAASLIMSRVTFAERVFTADLFGVPCKCRVDAYCADGMLVDLKTTTCAAPRAFARSAVDYGYYLQMAFYREILRANGRRVTGAVLVAVEKAAPHCVATYGLADADLDAMLPTIKAACNAYAAATASGVWSGYSGYIEDLPLPAWAIGGGA